MTYQIGSLGLRGDMDVMLKAACYEQGVDGHRFEWYGREYPASPSCIACRRQMKSTMEARGVPHETIARLFDKIGAKWEWVRDDLPSEDRPVTSLEGLDMLYGREGYLKWRKAQDDRVARQEIEKERATLEEARRTGRQIALEQKKLGWNLVYVAKLGRQELESNRQEQRQWTRVMNRRERMIEQGATPEEAVAQHPFSFGVWYAQGGDS